MTRPRKALPLLLSGLLAVGLLAVPGGARRDGTSGKSSPAADEVRRGKKLYRQNCAICHFDSSTAKKMGPGLKGLTKRGVYTSGKKVDDASLRAWIEEGGKNMPGFAEKLKPEEIRDLVAYLKTL